MVRPEAVVRRTAQSMMADYQSDGHRWACNHFAHLVPPICRANLAACRFDNWFCSQTTEELCNMCVLQPPPIPRTGDLGAPGQVARPAHPLLRSRRPLLGRYKDLAKMHGKYFESPVLKQPPLTGFPPPKAFPPSGVVTQLPFRPHCVTAAVWFSCDPDLL